MMLIVKNGFFDFVFGRRYESSFRIGFREGEKNYE